MLEGDEQLYEVNRVKLCPGGRWRKAHGAIEHQVFLDSRFVGCLLQEEVYGLLSICEINYRENQLLGQSEQPVFAIRLLCMRYTYF